jgi:hypothetical protein
MFTPLNARRTKRLKFEDDEVHVISGKPRERGLGHKAVVLIAGKIYDVFGEDCGSPTCACDARIVRRK